jgi:hypothetical protein
MMNVVSRTHPGSPVEADGGGWRHPLERCANPWPATVPGRHRTNVLLRRVLAHAVCKKFLVKITLGYIYNSGQIMIMFNLEGEFDTDFNMGMYGGY